MTRFAPASKLLKDAPLRNSPTRRANRPMLLPCGIAPHSPLRLLLLLVAPVWHILQALPHLFRRRLIDGAVTPVVAKAPDLCVSSHFRLATLDPTRRIEPLGSFGMRLRPILPRSSASPVLLPPTSPPPSFPTS